MLIPSKDKQGAKHKGYYSLLHWMVLFGSEKGKSGECSRKVLKNYYGRYEIDNNHIENNIHSVSLWVEIITSLSDAEGAAMINSFIGTCKLNNVEPFA